jgi:hypothetical protein
MEIDCIFHEVLSRNLTLQNYENRPHFIEVLPKKKTQLSKNMKITLVFFFGCVEVLSKPLNLVVFLFEVFEFLV